MTLVSIVFSIGVLAAAVYHNSLPLAIAGASLMLFSSVWMLIATSFILMERIEALIVVGRFSKKEEAK